LVAERPAGPRGLATAVRTLIAVFMVVAGVSHFTAHEEFLGQTPTFLPARSLIVWVTGVIEIGFGVALVALPRHRRLVGWLLAGFLVAIFPGNVWQAVAGTDAFGLDSDLARWLRLPFQPLLIALVLWSTGAWPRRRPQGKTARR
jgi:uncharacterized membrane protein